MNKEWTLLSDKSLPPVNKSVIVKDTRGSVTITKLIYSWEHRTHSSGAIFPSDGKAYWMLLPDIEVEKHEEESKSDHVITEDQICEILKIKRLLTPLKRLDLSPRAYNCLSSENIMFVGDIICIKDKSFLRKIPNFGKKSFNELIKAIKNNSFNLYVDFPEYFKEREKYLEKYRNI